MIKLFCSLNVNPLNILHQSAQQLINFHHFHQMAFSILIKNLQQLKGYTTTRFLREFRTKNWTRAQILTILKRSVIKTYNSAK